MVSKLTYLCIVTIFFIVLPGWKIATSNAYESARFTVVESDSPFEVREYPDLMIATTKMKSESTRDNGSFMRLFGYISGANDDKQKIAMTTPVFMQAKAGNKEAQMGFVLPKEVAAGPVPEPANEKVQITERAGGRFAVIRFKGLMNSKSISKAEQSLRDWITSKGLNGENSMESAGYDPPWTPGPMRRNEVLIRLQPTAEKSTAVQPIAEPTRPSSNEAIESLPDSK